MREEFDEIRPYEAGEMKQAFYDLLNDRQFQMILKGFFGLKEVYFKNIQ